MENILSIKGLRKSYGSLVALDNLHLKVPKGSVYGILGPNGSGKTTTLGIILGATMEEDGSFEWFEGQPLAQARKNIGAILETPAFYPYLNARKNLKIVADIKGISYSQINECLITVGLQDAAHRKFGTYSLGMKQRLALASALLSNPKVLVLDEPTNGLDAQGISLVRELILKISANGITILLASHLLDEVQKVCTHVAVLKKGKLVYDGEVNNMMTGVATIEISADDMDALGYALTDYPGLATMYKGASSYSVTLVADSSSKQLSQYLFQKSIVITNFTVKQATLEHQYMDLLKDS